MIISQVQISLLLFFKELEKKLWEAKKKTNKKQQQKNE